jgi:hypothetical protein
MRNMPLIIDVLMQGRTFDEFEYRQAKARSDIPIDLGDICFSPVHGSEHVGTDLWTDGEGEETRHWFLSIGKDGSINVEELDVTEEDFREP